MGVACVSLVALFVHYHWKSLEGRGKKDVYVWMT